MVEKYLKRFQQRQLKLKLQGPTYSSLAWELWLKGDQESGEPFQFDDNQISDAHAQYQMRLRSHISSAKYQSREAPKVCTQRQPPGASDEHLLTTIKHKMISNSHQKHNNINNNIKNRIKTTIIKTIILSSRSIRETFIVHNSA